MFRTSNDLLIEIDTLGIVIALAILVLASYRSFSSRRALAGSLYRSRALWTGIVALVLVILSVLQMVVENGLLTVAQANVAYGVLTPPAVVIIFLWIDRSIGVALDLDFLHRDTFRWKGFRKYAWGAIIVTAFLISLSTVVLLASVVSFIVITVSFAVTIAYSAAVLVRSGPRVHDTTMRAYMKWMGLMVLALVVEGATVSINYHLNEPFIIVSYFLYRTATSLSKKKRMPLEAVGPN